MAQWIPPILGLIVGGLLAWLLNGARGRVGAAAAEAREAEVRRELERTRDEAKAVSARLTAAENARVAAETRVTETEKNLTAQHALLENAKARLSDTFRSLAAEALSGSNRDFLVLADAKFKGLEEDTAGKLAQLVQPLQEHWSHTKKKQRICRRSGIAIWEAWVSAYGQSRKQKPPCARKRASS